MSLVAASGVFTAALLAALLHRNTFNGHVLTPLEQLPTALVIALIGSVCALLGTWVGLRRGHIHPLTYRAGLLVALIFVVASFLANEIFAAPRTVTIPSHEANVLGLEVLLISLVWGIGAPFGIALLVKRIRLVGRSHAA